jgi:plasmid stabilization system protein ParE
MRRYIVSPKVEAQLSELVAYLRNELKFSEEASLAYYERFMDFIRSFSANVDYPLCRFRRWRRLGWRCAVFEKDWVLAYEVLPEGVIVRDMSHVKLLKS